MPEKYLYNGKIVDSKEIEDAAKQSNLDIKSYTQKAGIKTIQDSYNFNGKSYSAEDVVNAASQSNMDFDAYVKKAGVNIPEPVKKKEVSLPSARELSTQFGMKSDNNSQLQQQQQIKKNVAATNVDYIANELPKKKAEAKKQILTPVAKSEDKFNPEEFIKLDTEGEGMDAMHKAMETNAALKGDELKYNAENLRNYFSNRMQEFSTKEKELNAQLQNVQQDKTLNNPERGDLAQSHPIDTQGIVKQETPQNEQDIYNQLVDLKDKRAKLSKAVDYFAKVYAHKLNPNATNKKVAEEVGRLTNDDYLKQLTRLDEKGIPLSDEDKLTQEQVGNSARATALEKEYENIPLDKRDDNYFSNAYNIDNQAKDAINQFPELKAKRMGQLLVQNLGDNAAQTLFEASRGNKAALKVIADKTGLTQKDISFVSTGDLPSESMMSNIGKGVWNAGTGIVTGLHRLIGSQFGEDRDRLDYINKKISESGNEIFGNNPYAQTEVSPTLINKDLQEVANPRAGKYSYNAESIKNLMGTATGNLLGFIGGTKGLGALGMGERAAMYGNIILGGQEQRYKQAEQVLGKDAPESVKNSLALLNGTIEAAAFEFLPKDKLGLAKIDKGVQKELADLVSTGSIQSVNKEVLKSTVQRAIESLGKSAGEAAKVTLATKAAGLTNAIVNTALGEKSDNSFDTFAESLKPNKLGEEFFGLALPLSIAEIPHMAKDSTAFKENLYDAGLNPIERKIALAKLVDEGKITEEQASQKEDVIDTMAKIQKSLPDINPTTGEKLTHSQQVEYAYNRVKEIANQAKKEGVKDDSALTQFYDKNAKELVDERKAIVEGTHDEYLNRSNIYDRIKEKETHKAVVNQGTKSEVVKYLAEQALTATDGTNNGLKKDVELTTDLIAQNSPLEIKDQIKVIKEKLKKENDKEDKNEPKIAQLEREVDMLNQGLEKTKKPEPKAEISVQATMDIPKSIEISGDANLNKANENGVVVDAPNQC